MNDLLDRLRDCGVCKCSHCQMRRDAADEIERLQEEIACLRPTGRSAVYDDYTATVSIVTEFWRHGSLEERVRAMAEDRQRLQSIVDRIPKTDDGVPIVPGMIVWHAGERWVVLAVGAFDCWLAKAGNRERRIWAGNNCIYSTREADKKARQQE